MKYDITIIYDDGVEHISTDSYETHLRELAQPPGTAFHDYLVDNTPTKMSLWDRICFWLLQKGFW